MKKFTPISMVSPSLSPIISHSSSTVDLCGFTWALLCEPSRRKTLTTSCSYKSQISFTECKPLPCNYPQNVQTRFVLQQNKRRKSQRHICPAVLSTIMHSIVALVAFYISVAVAHNWVTTPTTRNGNVAFNAGTSGGCDPSTELIILL